MVLHLMTQKSVSHFNMWLRLNIRLKQLCQAGRDEMKVVKSVIRSLSKSGITLHIVNLGINLFDNLKILLLPNITCRVY